MKVYLDHAATTPLDKRVLLAMTPHLTEVYANPSSSHAFGREALKSLDWARDSIAENLCVQPSEVYFTSSGSESDSWAVKGCAAAIARATGKKHVLISSVEHHAVLHSGEALKKEGFEVEYVPVDERGFVDITALQNSLRTDTALVCVMTANNEVGTLQPIEQICALTHQKGGVFFTDAVQAAGAMDMSKITSNADMVSFSAHKFYGPKGVGGLYIKKGTPILPLVNGGEQERGLRGGTSCVAGAVGMATALSLAAQEREQNTARLYALRQYFLERIYNEIEDVYLNGDEKNRLASNANLSFLGVEATSLLYRLDLQGVAVATGSACASGSIEPSHVLTAMGLPKERVSSALRFSFGKHNTEAEVDYTVETLKQSVASLRKK